MVNKPSPKPNVEESLHDFLSHKTVLDRKFTLCLRICTPGCAGLSGSNRLDVAHEVIFLMVHNATSAVSLKQQIMYMHIR